jgi:hypothetical protein
VAKSATGRWVSRVGASGGGKAYKKTRPGNFYGALAVIVILGLVATVWARYDYQHPPANPAGVQPKIGTTWYAAISLQACGKRLPFLPTDTSLKGQGMYILPADVVRVSPASAADSGNNATLAQFGNEYPGLLISTSQMNVPKNVLGAANPATSYTNGQTCPSGKGDLYGGQSAKVTYAYWSTFGQKKPTVTTNPATIKFAPDIRISIGFEPTGVTPEPPLAISDTAMGADATTVTTTTAATTVTTLPVTTTTVKGSTTTTTAPTTTTTSKG